MAVIGLEEAKLYLKVDTTDDDPVITALISAAEKFVEDYTGLRLLTFNFSCVLDKVGELTYVPFSPLQEVTKIEVIAEDGSVSVVDPGTYDVDTSSRQYGKVRLKPGYSWPEHRGFASFIISGKAGFGDNPADVPSPLKTAVLIVLAKLYESRGEARDEELYESIAALCLPFRVMRI